MKIEQIISPKQGGYATNDAGTKRIKREDIASTIKYVSKISGIPTKDLHKVGSTGKTTTSGDIDLAIDINNYPPSVIHKRMLIYLDNKGSYNSGTKIASYAVPIRGDGTNGLVQVDLMFTSNTNWAKFAYHSEGEGSKYKGAVRAILLSAVAAAKNEPGTDHFEYDDDGELKIRAGRTVDMSGGLRRIFQHRPQRSDGKGLIKSMKSMPIEDFKAAFPHANVKGGQIIIDDPDKVVKILFGGKILPKDINTAERIIYLIKHQFDDETQGKIFSFAAKRAKDLRSKMKLPPELLERME